MIEVGQRYRSYYRPFRGRARWPDGIIRNVVVKPQREQPDSTREHLLAEWCGYTIAHRLGLPVPPAYLVNIPESAIEPLGPAADGIIPGVAFATEIQQPFVQCGDFLFPEPAQIRNIDSIGGMVVLDTILGNNDRGDDVLAVAVPGSSKFDLRYIDNTWVAFGRELTVDQIQGRFPQSWALKHLARGLPGLPPYVLGARNLDPEELEQAFQNAPSDFQAGAPASCSALASTFAWRGEHIEDALVRTRPADI